MLETNTSPVFLNRALTLTLPEIHALEARMARLDAAIAESLKEASAEALAAELYFADGLIGESERHARYAKLARIDAQDYTETRNAMARRLEAARYVPTAFESAWNEAFAKFGQALPETLVS